MSSKIILIIWIFYNKNEDFKIIRDETYNNNSGIEYIKSKIIKSSIMPSYNLLEPSC